MNPGFLRTHGDPRPQPHPEHRSDGFSGAVVDHDAPAVAYIVFEHVQNLFRYGLFIAPRGVNAEHLAAPHHLLRHVQMRTEDLLLPAASRLQPDFADAEAERVVETGQQELRDLRRGEIGRDVAGVDAAEVITPQSFTVEPGDRVFLPDEVCFQIVGGIDPAAEAPRDRQAAGFLHPGNRLAVEDLHHIEMAVAVNEPDIRGSVSPDARPAVHHGVMQLQTGKAKGRREKPEIEAGGSTVRPSLPFRRSWPLHRAPARSSIFRGS